MGVIQYRVTVDMENMKRFKRYLKSNRGPISDAYKDWARYYANFTLKRFRRFSFGSGNWRALKKQTVDQKRRLGVSHPQRILVRSKKLMKAISPSFVRRSATIRRRGIRMEVTYGSKLRYRKNKYYPYLKGRGVEVAQVIKWHDDGAPPNPKRRIFINPDRPTQRRMGKRMEEAIQEILDE